jgi:hypothetical protein
MKAKRFFLFLAALGSVSAACLREPAWAATLTVSTTDDIGPGTLRQAIAQAAPGDTIHCSVTGTITLTNGELIISTNLILVGPGAARLTLNGAGITRVLRIAGGAVTVSGLTIAQGRSTNGGGIWNQAASLTLVDCTFATNAAMDVSPVSAQGQGRFGGGIFNEGELIIRQCLFVGNRVQGGEGVGHRVKGVSPRVSPGYCRSLLGVFGPPGRGLQTQSLNPDAIESSITAAAATPFPLGDPTTNREFWVSHLLASLPHSSFPIVQPFPGFPSSP